MIAAKSLRLGKDYDNNEHIRKFRWFEALATFGSFEISAIFSAYSEDQQNEVGMLLLCIIL